MHMRTRQEEWNGSLSGFIDGLLMKGEWNVSIPEIGTYQMQATIIYFKRKQGK